MKRNIVVNSQRSAIVISDNLSDAVKMVYKDTSVGDEIFAFDTSMHIAYSYRVVKNGYEITESEVPVRQFRNFASIGNHHEIYMSLIKSLTC